MSGPSPQVSMTIVHSASFLSDEQVVNPISPDTSTFLATVQKSVYTSPLSNKLVLKGSIPPLPPGIQNYCSPYAQIRAAEITGQHSAVQKCLVGQE